MVPTFSMSPLVLLFIQYGEKHGKCYITDFKMFTCPASKATCQERRTRGCSCYDCHLLGTQDKKQTNFSIHLSIRSHQPIFCIGQMELCWDQNSYTKTNIRYLAGYFSSNTGTFQCTRTQQFTMFQKPSQKDVLLTFIMIRRTLKKVKLGRGKAV